MPEGSTKSIPDNLLSLVDNCLEEGLYGRAFDLLTVITAPQGPKHKSYIVHASHVSLAATVLVNPKISFDTESDQTVIRSTTQFLELVFDCAQNDQYTSDIVNQALQFNQARRTTVQSRRRHGSGQEANGLDTGSMEELQQLLDDQSIFRRVSSFWHLVGYTFGLEGSTESGRISRVNRFETLLDLLVYYLLKESSQGRFPLLQSYLQDEENQDREPRWRFIAKSLATIRYDSSGSFSSPYAHTSFNPRGAPPTLLECAKNGYCIPSDADSSDLWDLIGPIATRFLIIHLINQYLEQTPSPGKRAKRFSQTLAAEFSTLPLPIFQCVFKELGHLCCYDGQFHGRTWPLRLLKDVMETFDPKIDISVKIADFGPPEQDIRYFASTLEAARPKAVSMAKYTVALLIYCEICSHSRPISDTIKNALSAGIGARDAAFEKAVKSKDPNRIKYQHDIFVQTQLHLSSFAESPAQKRLKFEKLGKQFSSPSPPSYLDDKTAIAKSTKQILTELEMV